MARTAARLDGSTGNDIPVPAGRLVVRQGQPVAGPSQVMHGALFESAVDDDGRVLGLDVLGPGDLVGGPHACPATADVRALGPCRLRPASAAQLGWLLEDRRQRAADLARQLAWLGVGERVVCRLNDLAARFGRPTPSGMMVRLPLTQEDLAALCGTSRESANRALRRLDADGTIHVVGRGRFLIPSLHVVEARP